MHRALVLLGCAFHLCAKAAAAQTSNAISYVYDGVGRLAAVIDPSGDAAGYQYDGVGNMRQGQDVDLQSLAGTFGSHCCCLPAAVDS